MSMMITIWGNALFGCEMAVALCRRIRNARRTVCLADLDLLAPAADLFLGISRTTGGLAALISMTEESPVAPEALRRLCARPAPNMYVVTGNCRLDQYEYFTEAMYTRLLQELEKCFDILVCLVNRNIYDLFTILSLHRSAWNIAAPEPYLAAIREYNACIGFISQKQEIPAVKTKFVAFTLFMSRVVSPMLMEELTDGNYIGGISRSSSREKAMRSSRSCLGYLDGRNEEEYAGIACRLGINNLKTKKGRCVGNEQGDHHGKTDEGSGTPYDEEQ